MIAGDPENYKTGYQNIYCDLDTLKQVLKKEFNGRAIPGQPTTKNGKPYKDFCYSSAKVKVDDQDKLDEVVSGIRSMGYNADVYKRQSLYRIHGSRPIKPDCGRISL